jgi:hypothetical protein
MVEQICKFNFHPCSLLKWTRMLIEVGLCEYYIDIIVEQNKNLDTLIGYYVMRQQETFHNLQPWFHLWPTTHTTQGTKVDSHWSNDSITRKFLGSKYIILTLFMDENRSYQFSLQSVLPSNQLKDASFPGIALTFPHLCLFAWIGNNVLPICLAHCSDGKASNEFGRVFRGALTDRA